MGYITAICVYEYTSNFPRFLQTDATNTTTTDDDDEDDDDSGGGGGGGSSDGGGGDDDEWWNTWNSFSNIIHLRSGHI